MVYAFSTTDRESFLEIEKWKQKVESECGEICAVLVPPRPMPSGKCE